MSKSIEGLPADSEQVDAQPSQAQPLEKMPSFEEHMDQVSKKTEQIDTVGGVYDSGKKEQSYDFAPVQEDEAAQAAADAAEISVNQAPRKGYQEFKDTLGDLGIPTQEDERDTGDEDSGYEGTGDETSVPHESPRLPDDYLDHIDTGDEDTGYEGTGDETA